MFQILETSVYKLYVDHNKKNPLETIHNKNMYLNDLKVLSYERERENSGQSELNSPGTESSLTELFWD